MYRLEQIVDAAKRVEDVGGLFIFSHDISEETLKELKRLAVDYIFINEGVIYFGDAWSICVLEP
jgi:hypothetical protein